MSHFVCEDCGKFISEKKKQRHKSRCGVQGEKKMGGNTKSFRKMSLLQKLKDKVKNKGEEAVQNEMDELQDKRRA